MSTRDRILDAAAHVMRTRGLARTTTKEIARAAGCSEAALYKYFRDKADLFLAVLSERTPNSPVAMFDGLRQRVGRGLLRETLEEVARAAVDFYHHTFPIGASLFSEPELLAAHREALRRYGIGPQHVVDTLADYLVAEQHQGGIRPDADPQAAAALLLGACFQRAFLCHFVDRPDDEDARRSFAASLTRTLLAGLLAPPGDAPGEAVPVRDEPGPERASG
ncbi:TetR/AcrR family transcriptional regulator [Micromonospora sp. HM5-17]|jgi:AcrR family transcriptional regulator|uniref:TetR/AcrR family transcriptional regulator n=1 Tax=Micromonospora sp. HM5-17 TaxID=2487710 RepID=UPI000F466958|nr:TetR/AcrR family transcriptional regulator [Micromonospora sp. HM5-17]ROT34338.1 TetR/AcrR family transcriptional regulator [Micromonospora sp. HM5-17]